MSPPSFRLKPRRTTYKTYTHLGENPSVYEITTSKLLYYPEKGFEVETPITDWVKKYQINGLFDLKTCESFSDPREITYSKYTLIRREKENELSAILEEKESKEYFLRLSGEWIKSLETYLAPLVFPLHALQMASSYVAHLAPSGKVVVPAMFMAADQLKQVQKIAYRTALLRKFNKNFGEKRKEIWEREALWQPLRQVMEELLVAYDWGEAFIALNLSVKPAFDKVFLDLFSQMALHNQDESLSLILHSLLEDGVWHTQWSENLSRIIKENPKNAELLTSLTLKWSEKIRIALDPIQNIFENHPSQALGKTMEESPYANG